MAEARCDPIPTARIHQKLYGWLMFGRYRGRSRRNNIDGRHCSRHFTQHTHSLSAALMRIPPRRSPLCFAISACGSLVSPAGAQAQARWYSSVAGPKL
jgi:hypothetical protein